MRWGRVLLVAGLCVGIGLTGSADAAPSKVVRPKALLKAKPNPAAVGTVVTFDPRKSVQTPGVKVGSWSVDFGDHHAARCKGGLKTVRHTYRAPGSYTVLLRITDKQGQTRRYRMRETVRATGSPSPSQLLPSGPAPTSAPGSSPVVPTLSVDGAASGRATVGQQGAGAVFDATGTVVPAGVTITSGSLSFDDGTEPRALTGPVSGWKVTHAFASAGTYHPTLTILDGSQHTATAAVAETLYDAPSLAVTGGSATVGSPLTLTVAADYRSAGPQSYDVTWDAGAAAEHHDGAIPASLMHVYASGGAHQISATVHTDAAGAVTATGAGTVTTPVLTAVLAVNGSTADQVRGSTDDEGGITGVVVDATGSSAGFGQSLVSATVTYGDGQQTTFTGAPATWTETHHYAAGFTGSHVIGLSVQDNASATASDSTTIALFDAPEPSVSVDDDTGVIGQPTVAHLSAGLPSGTALVAYTISWGDGASADVVASSLPSTLSHTYTAGGQRTIALTVHDDAAGQGAVTDDVVVTGASTTAAFDGQPEQGGGDGTQATVDNTILFDATASYPQTGTSVESAFFDYGDGESEDVTGTWKGSHEWANPGPFVVTLTLTDDDGMTFTTTSTVTVHPASSLDATVPATAVAAGSPTTATLTFSGQPGVQVTGWSAAWGDDVTTGASTPLPATVQHAYATPGSWAPCITFFTGWGQAGSSCPDAQVGDASSLVAASLYSNQGDEDDVVFDETHSHVSRSTVQGLLTLEDRSHPQTGNHMDAISTDWGDGSSDDGGSVSHSYAAAGAYQVQHVVHFVGGGTTTITIPVKVYASPTVSLTGPATIAHGATATFAVTSSPATGTSTSGWAVDYGDNTSDSGFGAPPANLTHSWPVEDVGLSYAVTLTVTDDVGGAGSVQQVVKVT